MTFKFKNRFTSVSLRHFSGEIERLEYPTQLTYPKAEPIQHGGQIHPNNIIFKIRSKAGDLRRYQFSNANFDFRIGHFISVLTSENSHLHRLVINHNTQRVWYPNANSAAKEFRLEKILVLSLIISTFLVAAYSFYFFAAKFIQEPLDYSFTILAIFLFLVLSTALIVLQVLRHYDSFNLHERILRSNLKGIALKILKEQSENISTIR